MVVLNFVALFLLLVSSSNGEMFTSVAHIREAIYAQRKTVGELKNYVAEEKAKLGEIKKMAENLVRESSPVPDDAFDDFISNPISAYLTVKHSLRDHFDLKKLLGNDRLVNKTLNQMKPHVEMLPTEQDFEGALAGLLRLQETYEVTASVLADGFNRRASNRTSKMTTSDCFEIGRVAYGLEKYETAVIWFNEVSQRIAKEEVPSFVDKVLLLEYLSFSNFKIGEVTLALNQTQEMLKLNPNHAKAWRNMRYYKHLLSQKNADRNIEMLKQASKLLPTLDNDNNYKKLCRGEKTMPIKNAKNLYCDYARNNDPRLLIAPLKRETIHLDPWIMVYYDVIDDEEIAYFKQVALPMLHRARAIDPRTGQMEKVDYRISEIAWLENNTDRYYTPRILNRITAMTQLTLQHSELLQVANYGIGGYYRTHFDFSDDDKVDHFGPNNPGNRFATLLFYMSDVEAGGATIFNDLGLTIFPKKGAAAVWYNLYKNGKGDKTLSHAACPVLYGSKWVMNKWYHYSGNEFWHLCSPVEFDRFKPEDLEKAMSTYHRAHGRFSFD